MIPAWWSLLLAGIGVFGLYLTTRPEPIRWWGFGVGFAVQFLWIAYAITTSQPGFILSALVYGAVNTIGLNQWRKQRQEADTIAAIEDRIEAGRFTKRALAALRGDRLPDTIHASPHPPRGGSGQACALCHNEHRHV